MKEIRKAETTDKKIGGLIIENSKGQVYVQ